MGRLLEKLNNNIHFCSYKDIHYIISDYLLNHFNRLESLTLVALSKEALVSKSSIIKFYNEAGFSSYRLFINQLLHEIELDASKVVMLIRIQKCHP